MRHLLLFSVILLGFPQHMQADDPWRYVPGDPDEIPPLRALTFLAQRPPGLRPGTGFRGSTQRYAMLPYGTHGTKPILVVLDEVSDTEADLYVDRGRKGTVQESDRVQGRNGTWRVALETQVLSAGSQKTASRMVLFQRGRLSGTLGIGTCGHLEGKVRLGNRLVLARRIDGDANGLFADPQDRLHLDLNGDGRFDPLDECFLFAPILPLGAVRYAIRSDSLGQQLTFAPIEGTGLVRLAFSSKLAVETATVTLQGKDGTLVSLHGRNGSATVPVGEYRISSLSLTVRSDQEDAPWTYLFSDNDARLSHRWYTIDKGATISLDPMGRIQLQTGIGGIPPFRPGDLATVQPRLETGDGLLVSSIFRGHDESAARFSNCRANILLSDSKGTALDRTSTGFS